MIARVYANIRGVQRCTNKNGDDYLLVRLEDETGKPAQLVDKDMSREKYYVRNTEGVLVINIDFGRWTNVRIVDFKINQGVV